MKTTIHKLAIFGLLTATLAIAPTRAFCEEKKAEKPAASEDAAKPKRDTAPARGKIGSIDKTAMTFTVGERTFQVTAETKITKAGKPATLEDATVGEEVGIFYRKMDDGKLVALTLRIGPKPEAAAE